MDSERFDGLAKSLSAAVNRRRMLGGFLGGGLAAGLALTAPADSDARRRRRRRRSQGYLAQCTAACQANAIGGRGAGCHGLCKAAQAGEPREDISAFISCPTLIYCRRERRRGENVDPLIGVIPSINIQPAAPVPTCWFWSEPVGCQPCNGARQEVYESQCNAVYPACQGRCILAPI
jgi:hypothetical protein